MNHDLQGKSVAILATDGFEQSELEKPRAALEKAGVKTSIVSPKKDSITGWSGDAFGDDFDVDVPLKKANADDFDGLLLPGGVMNPDQLRQEPEAVEFVRAFFDAGKPVAAICHGPQMLIEADVVRGRTLTSYPSLKTDLTNAGAAWIDDKVVDDGNHVTSRKPSDIPQFNAKMLEGLATTRAASRRKPALM